MASISPKLTLWTVLPLPLLIIIFFKSATVLDKRYEHLQTRISRFNAIMEACFSGIRVVKAYVREKAQKRKFEEILIDRRNAEISAIKATVIVDSLYMYIWQFGIVIVLLAGGYMVINANLSLGKLVAFIYYVFYLIFPMFDIGQFLVKSRQSAVSVDRLIELENVIQRALIIRSEKNLIKSQDIQFLREQGQSPSHVFSEREKKLFTQKIASTNKAAIQAARSDGKHIPLTKITSIRQKATQ